MIFFLSLSDAYKTKYISLSNCISTAKSVDISNDPAQICWHCTTFLCTNFFCFQDKLINQDIWRHKSSWKLYSQKHHLLKLPCQYQQKIKQDKGSFNFERSRLPNWGGIFARSQNSAFWAISGLIYFDFWPKNSLKIIFCMPQWSFMLKKLKWLDFINNLLANPIEL